MAAANLSRSYRRAPKAAGEKDCGAEGAGICHLCMAGTGVDWEDLPLTTLLEKLYKLFLKKSIYMRI